MYHFPPILKILSLGMLIAYTDKQVLTDLGKFSDVVTITVKVETQHLIVDKGGNLLIFFLLNLSMTQTQQETELLQLVVYQIFFSTQYLYLLKWYFI